jgi:hypothetical protein
MKGNNMLAKKINRISARPVAYMALVAAMLLVMFFTMMGSAKAADVTTVSPASARLGSSFRLEMSGYLPGERVNLWATSPTGTASDASYIYADANGKLILSVETSDPNSLTDEDEANFTKLVSVYDDDNNLVEQYLEIILHQPTRGAWAMTAQGSESGLTQVGSFTVS